MSIQRNIRLTLEYDGTDFHGWQVQPGARTVQGEIETCLNRLLEAHTRLIGAGRTDAGVHALGQVANFKTRKPLGADRIRRALNAMLPPDIAVLEAGEVPQMFHARFDATQRAYLYRIGFARRAIGRQFAWQCRFRLNPDAMRAAAGQLLGCHDFTSFCVAAAERENRVCRLSTCAWQEQDGELLLHIEADRFLRAMVRSIVGTLVEIGRGARPVEEISRILQARDRRLAGPTAPPHGLFLKRVVYTDTAGG